LGGKDSASVKFFDVPESRDAVVYLNDFNLADRSKGMTMGNAPQEMMAV